MTCDACGRVLAAEWVGRHECPIDICDVGGDASDCDSDKENRPPKSPAPNPIELLSPLYFLEYV